MAGKGCAPRSCFSPAFKDRYEEIDWRKGKLPKADRERPRPNWRKELEAATDND